MSQAWAYAFYHSRGWKDCRRAFLESRHWLCERCHKPARIAHHKTYLTPANIGDPDVTLNWKRLEALCEDCHNEEHHSTIKATRPGFAFDEEGNLIQA
jgi:5-methylcytosine-specific restriction endonuclease McrA